MDKVKKGTWAQTSKMPLQPSFVGPTVLSDKKQLKMRPYTLPAYSSTPQILLQY